MNEILAYFGLMAEKPWVLVFIVPAVFGVVAFYAWRFWAAKRVLKKNAYFRRLHGDELKPQLRRYVMGALRSSAIIVMLIIVYAEPHTIKVNSVPVYGGVRIAFLKDVSTSMKYGHDVDPYPDRLVAAKDVLVSFASMTEKDPELKGEYWRAVIPFAGSAMTYMPFSTSYKEFISVIDSIDETTIGHPGTNLWEPVRHYEQMLKDYPNKDPNTVDLMVLISDGGKGEGAHLDLPHIRAALARMKGVVPFAVGIGDPKRGTPLEIRDRFGKRAGYLLEDPEDPKRKCADNDPKCRPVISLLDEQTLQAIAGSPERYIHYSGKDAFLEKLKKAIIDNRKLMRVDQHAEPTPIGFWFLIPAVLLLLQMLGLLRLLRNVAWYLPAKFLKGT